MDCSAIPNSVPVNGVCQCAQPAFNISALSNTRLVACLPSGSTNCPPAYPVATRRGTTGGLISCSTAGSTCPPNSLPLYSAAGTLVECRDGAKACPSAYGIPLQGPPPSTPLVGCLSSTATTCPAAFNVPVTVGSSLAGCLPTGTSSCPINYLLVRNASNTFTGCASSCPPNSLLLYNATGIPVECRVGSSSCPASFKTDILSPAPSWNLVGCLSNNAQSCPGSYSVSGLSNNSVAACLPTGSTTCPAAYPLISRTDLGIISSCSTSSSSCPTASLAVYDSSGAVFACRQGATSCRNPYSIQVQGSPPNSNLVGCLSNNATACPIASYSVRAVTNGTLTACLPTSSTGCPTNYPVPVRDFVNSNTLTSCLTSSSSCPPNSLTYYDSSTAVVECRQGTTTCTSPYLTPVQGPSPGQATVGCLSRNAAACPAGYTVRALSNNTLSACLPTGTKTCPAAYPGEVKNLAGNLDSCFAGNRCPSGTLALFSPAGIRVECRAISSCSLPDYLTPLVLGSTLTANTIGCLATVATTCSVPAFPVALSGSGIIAACLQAGTTTCDDPNYPVVIRSANVTLVGCTWDITECPPNSLPLYNATGTGVECRVGVSSCPAQFATTALGPPPTWAVVGCVSNNATSCPAAYSLPGLSGSNSLAACLPTGSSTCPAAYPLPTRDSGGNLVSCSTSSTSCPANSLPLYSPAGVVTGCGNAGTAQQGGGTTTNPCQTSPFTIPVQGPPPGSAVVGCLDNSTTACPASFPVVFSGQPSWGISRCGNVSACPPFADASSQFSVPGYNSNGSLVACLTTNFGPGSVGVCPSSLPAAGGSLDLSMEALGPNPVTPPPDQRTLACLAPGSTCPSQEPLRLYAGSTSAPTQVYCMAVPVNGQCPGALSAAHPVTGPFDIPIRSSSGQLLGCVISGITACPADFPIRDLNSTGAIVGCSANGTSVVCPPGNVPLVNSGGITTACEQLPTPTSECPDGSSVAALNFPISVRDSSGVVLRCLAPGSACPTANSVPFYSAGFGVVPASGRPAVRQCWPTGTSTCSSNYPAEVRASDASGAPLLGCVSSTATLCPLSSSLEYRAADMSITQCRPGAQATCPAASSQPPYNQYSISAYAPDNTLDACLVNTILSCPASSFPLPVSTSTTGTPLTGCSASTSSCPLGTILLGNGTTGAIQSCYVTQQPLADCNAIPNYPTPATNSSGSFIGCLSQVSGVQSCPAGYVTKFEVVVDTDRAVGCIQLGPNSGCPRSYPLAGVNSLGNRIACIDTSRATTPGACPLKGLFTIKIAQTAVSATEACLSNDQPTCPTNWGRFKRDFALFSDNQPTPSGPTPLAGQLSGCIQPPNPLQCSGTAPSPVYKYSNRTGLVGCVDKSVTTSCPATAPVAFLSGAAGSNLDSCGPALSSCPASHAGTLLHQGLLVGCYNAGASFSCPTSAVDAGNRGGLVYNSMSRVGTPDGGATTWRLERCTTDNSTACPSAYPVLGLRTFARVSACLQRVLSSNLTRLCPQVAQVGANAELAIPYLSTVASASTAGAVACVAESFLPGCANSPGNILAKRDYGFSLSSGTNKQGGGQLIACMEPAGISSCSASGLSTYGYGIPAYNDGVNPAVLSGCIDTATPCPLRYPFFYMSAASTITQCTRTQLPCNNTGLPSYTITMYRQSANPQSVAGCMEATGTWSRCPTSAASAALTPPGKYDLPLFKPPPPPNKFANFTNPALSSCINVGSTTPPTDCTQFASAGFPTPLYKGSPADSSNVLLGCMAASTRCPETGDVNQVYSAPFTIMDVPVIYDLYAVVIKGCYQQAASAVSKGYGVDLTYWNATTKTRQLVGALPSNATAGQCLTTGPAWTASSSYTPLAPPYAYPTTYNGNNGPLFSFDQSTGLLQCTFFATNAIPENCTYPGDASSKLALRVVNNMNGALRLTGCYSGGQPECVRYATGPGQVFPEFGTNLACLRP